MSGRDQPLFQPLAEKATECYLRRQMVRRPAKVRAKRKHAVVRDVQWRLSQVSAKLCSEVMFELEKSRDYGHQFRKN